MEEIKVGIDLGTTNSAVAAIGEDGRPFIVTNGDGNRITPSVVGSDRGDVVVGDNAKDLQSIGCVDTAAFFKRHMGDPNFRVELDGTTYDAAGLSALLLRQLVDDAESRLGKRIASAVVTVPAYYRSTEREAVLQACRAAGITLQGLIAEPSAAAYAYGLSEETPGKTLLVYDFGGGTFDVTVARVGTDEIRVLGCDGDHHLGGKDFDDALANLMVDLLCERCGADPDGVELTAGESAALAVQAEQVKRQLSSRESVRVPLNVAGMNGTIEVRRIDFELATMYLARKAMDVVDRLMRELGLLWAHIDAVVPVGGMTRMPMILEALESRFHQKPCGGVNPDEAVALGAAIRANLPPRCLLGGADETPKLHIAGAAEAPQLALAGAKRLVDVTAHAMGMVAESPDRARYVNSEIIPRNAVIPAAEGRTYALRVPPAGGELEVYVLQGSYDRVLDNDVCGKYIVRGIQREPGGESLVEVEYRYNANAIIEVEARQPSTGARLTVERVPVEADLSRFDGVPPELTGAVQGAVPDIYLVFDVSGSMSGSPLDKAKSAMRAFVDEFPPNSARIGVIFFSDKNLVVQEPTCDYDAVRNAIERARADVFDLGYGNEADPFGFVYDEVLAAGDVLKMRASSTTGLLKKVAKRAKQAFGGGDDPYTCLVVLTDGVWYHQDWSRSNARNLADHGVDIVAVGFGAADERFLRDVATKDDYAALVGVNALQETFTKIGRALATGEEPRVA